MSRFDRARNGNGRADCAQRLDRRRGRQRQLNARIGQNAGHVRQLVFAIRWRVLVGGVPEGQAYGGEEKS